MTTSLELPSADLSEATPFSIRIAATRLPQFPRKTGIERRAHRRHAAHEIDWVRRARLKNGPDVAVIDLSVGGALVDVNAHLRLGSFMTLEIAGPDDEVEIPFEVLRCYVSKLQGGTTTYRGACAFTQPLQLARVDKVACHKPRGPLNEFIGLDAALRIFSGAIQPSRRRHQLANVWAIFLRCANRKRSPWRERFLYASALNATQGRERLRVADSCDDRCSDGSVDNGSL
jgi:hypothetical protein